MQKHYQPNAQGVLVPPTARHFSYTDGARAEQYIAAVIREASDRSVFSPEFVQKSMAWVVKYHLSPQRSYLLRPVRHLLNNSLILELGAGCGALTRYMGEIARRLIALEGSPVRAGIAAARCKDLRNVAVINDTIQDLLLPQKFDIVTLIGVLEYARLYDSSSESPELAILQKARELLKPDGHLLLAIENKLGLKYFAGAPEDHAGMPFFGVHGLYGRGTVVTFGRQELENLLRRAGFASLTQLVPLPDYKLPVSVLHPAAFDGGSPSMAVYPLALNSIAYDSQQSSEKCFSLESAYKTIIENGLLPDLCNSFYYIASREKAPAPLCPDILASHYGGQRYKEFARETLFVRADDRVHVKKRYLCDDARHENDLLANTAPPHQEYQRKSTLYETVMPVVNTPGWTVADLAAWASPWLAYLRSQESSGMLPPSSMDMVPANFFLEEDGTLLPFDCEWQPADKSGLPFNYVALRGLFQTLATCSSVAPPDAAVPLMILPLAKKILSEHNVAITEADIKFFVLKYAEFSKAATGVQAGVDTLFGFRLKVRELA